MSAELLENNPGLLDDPFGRSDEDVGTLGKDCDVHIAKRIPCVKCEHVVNCTYCGVCGVEVERAVRLKSTDAEWETSSASKQADLWRS